MIATRPDKGLSFPEADICRRRSRFRRQFPTGSLSGAIPFPHSRSDIFMTNGNGAPLENAAPPQFNVLAQYIKDFSFENPNSPASLAAQDKQPTINIQINVTATPVAENDFEVSLSIDGKAEIDTMVLFAFELIYAGVFRIQNVPQDSMHPFIMIECPRLLFPFAREIVASSVRAGGFPPLMLDPVDFVGLYRQNMARQAEQQQGKPS